MLGISGWSRVGPLGSLLPALPSFVPPPVSGEFGIKVHNRGAIFTGYPATTERAEVPVRREGSHLSLLFDTPARLFRRWAAVYHSILGLAALFLSRIGGELKIDSTN
jgi:hypothetical protein